MGVIAGLFGFFVVLSAVVPIAKWGGAVCCQRRCFPKFLETPCGIWVHANPQPELLVRFLTHHGLGKRLQELGINITREVFQAWLKDPEFVPQRKGGFLNSWGPWVEGMDLWDPGQSPGRSRS